MGYINYKSWNSLEWTQTDEFSGVTIWDEAHVMF